MKILCEFLGGSHSYGLNTESSDIDKRGCFITTDIHNTIGLGRFEHQIIQNETEDKSYKELRHFLQLLRNGNSEAIEMLFLQDHQFDLITLNFKLIRNNKLKLIDSEKLFKCLSGYAISEYKTTFGITTGKLGSQRKELIDKYGYCPKNAVQMLRLLWAGAYFFRNNVFPVKIKNYDIRIHSLLFKIKTQPETFHKKEIEQLFSNFDIDLKSSFDNRKETFKFNNDFADEICLIMYYDVIEELYNKIRYVKYQNNIFN